MLLVLRHTGLTQVYGGLKLRGNYSSYGLELKVA